MSRAALRARWQRLSRACSVTAADEALIARSASTLPMPHSAPLPSFGRILQRAGRGEPRQNPAHSNPPRRAGIWLLPSPAAVALPPGSHHQRVRPFRSLKSDQAVSSYRPADPQILLGGNRRRQARNEETISLVRAAVEFEASKGYINVISNTTGRQFSNVLEQKLTLLHAEEGMIRMACSYPDMSRSQRHEFLEDVKAGLEALGRPREEGGFEEVKAKGEFQDGGKSKGGTKPPLGGAWEEPRREQAISQVPQRTHLIPQEIPQQESAPTPIPIMFDLETSGFRPHGRIIEVGAYSPLTLDTFQQLVKHSCKLRPTIVEVTGITDEMLAGPEAVDMNEALSEFVGFVERQITGPGQVPVLVAHNGRRFDFPVLWDEAKRSNVQLPGSWLYLDSLSMAKALVTNGQDSLKLGSLRKHFNVESTLQAHRALADAMVLSGVMAGLLNSQAEAREDPEQLLLRHSFAAGAGEKPFVKLGDAPLRHQAQSARAPIRRSTKHGAQGSAGGDGDDGTRHEVPSSPSASGVSKPTPPSPPSPLLDAADERTRQAAPRLQSGDGAARRLLGAGGLSAGLETPGMFLMPISTCKELTPTQRQKLEEGGFYDVEKLVTRHLPRTYINWQENALVDGGSVALTGYVLSNRVYHPKPSMSVLKVLLSVRPGQVEEQEGEAGEGGATPKDEETKGYQKVAVSKFMRGSYAKAALLKMSAKIPQGGLAVIRGKLAKAEDDGDCWEMTGNVEVMTPAEWSKMNSATDAAGDMQPVYAAVKSLSSKDFLKIMPRALNAMEGSRCAEEPLPPETLQRLDLMPWMEALRTIHNPRGHKEREGARRRLAFQELFMLQLGLLMRRRKTTGEQQLAHTITTIPDGEKMVGRVLAALPFELTRGQKEALEEIMGDLRSGRPMLRLLQGDVGCGKTIVAFLAMLTLAASGWQVALMAPTEVLAVQHKNSLDGLLQRLQGPRVPSVAILTGSTRAAPRREILEGLADGSLSIVIGTHSLISSGVDFNNLGLAVIDEQHRFGVEQRSALQRSSSPTPHVLSLSATPIPRTLALVAHGDMDISIISERPPGRTPVKTRVLPACELSRGKAYSLIRRELTAGFRSYVVCPLVESSEADGMEELKAAEDEYTRLQEGGYLGDARCGLLHGRLSAEEKSRALRDFAEGRTQVLIATSVVEVGVDVPQASVMVVEHAERFGLAQLHQLRGRIGRGERPSECVLLVSGGQKGMSRVKVLESSENGFEIAEADLNHRGPGEILGTRQSGTEAYTALQVTRFPDDEDLLESAREEAKGLLDGAEGSEGIPARLWAAYQASSPPDLDFSVSNETVVTAAQQRRSS